MDNSVLCQIPDNSPGGFFVYRATGSEELCFADQNIIALHGCATMEEFAAHTGNSFRGMVHPDDLDRVESEIYAQTFACGERHDYVHYRIITRQGEVKYVEDFGHLVYDREGNSYFYVFADDVEESEYHKINQSDWETRVGYRRAEFTSALTGLKYESGFYAECERNLATSETGWIVFAIDITNFKLFNEWYGREAGDNVLSAVGQTLGRIADEHGGVAGYFGGDDFALMIEASGSDAEELYERIHEAVLGHGISVGFLPAMGASFSEEGASAYTLYDQASLACIEAKAGHMEHVKFFTKSMVSKAEEDHRILSEFEDALANNEITFYLQPQCRSADGRIVGAEALARWIKPDGRVIPPISFIPKLEQHGFIPDLDRRVWEEVAKWMRKVLDEGKPLIPVSVNISPVDIFAMDVPAFFGNLVKTYGLPKEAVKVEITESAYSEGSDKVRSCVQAFREMGFMVLMDDFGSGFSSLNMLRELNVDVLKLDAYFLRMDKQNERKGMHILESVVNMAKTMAMPIIVEGVETKEHHDYLMDLGIRYIQGYYYYKPMPTALFETLISTGQNVDTSGLTFKANEEFGIREFLNDTVYTDSMLNHIIGPAAIYCVHGDEIDIVRFNEMFYREVNVPDFEEKLSGIQKVMPKHEVAELFATFKKAYEDRLNGADGMFTFRKYDGTAARFLIHFYYLNEDKDSVRYYGAARDVTNITNLNRRMELLSQFMSRTVLLLSYAHGEYSFDIAAHGLEKDLGISREELAAELNANAFYKRLVPASARSFWKIAHECAETKENTTSELTIRGNEGKQLRVIVEADHVDDELGNVRCILSMRKK